MCHGNDVLYTLLIIPYNYQSSVMGYTFMHVISVMLRAYSITIRMKPPRGLFYNADARLIYLDYREEFDE